MALKVLASELIFILIRTDLSAMVKKYVGEAEKNLRELIDSVEDGGDLLMFDEADTFFGKRSEGKDNHDRYANIEIGYLLQRMEVYRCFAILATNFKSLLDSAFIRRLRIIISFPFLAFRGKKPSFIWFLLLRCLRLNWIIIGFLFFYLTGHNVHNTAFNVVFMTTYIGISVTMPDGIKHENKTMKKSTLKYLCDPLPQPHPLFVFFQ